MSQPIGERVLHTRMDRASLRDYLESPQGQEIDLAIREPVLALLERYRSTDQDNGFVEHTVGEHAALTRLAAAIRADDQSPADWV
jgi:hypothetical protein